MGYSRGKDANCIAFKGLKSDMALNRFLIRPGLNMQPYEVAERIVAFQTGRKGAIYLLHPDIKFPANREAHQEEGFEPDLVAIRFLFYFFGLFCHFSLICE